LQLEAESIFGKYFIDINENTSEVLISDLSGDKSVALTLKDFEGINPSHKLEIFGAGCRIIDARVKKAINTNNDEPEIEEKLVEATLALLIADFTKRFGSQQHKLKSCVYHSSALEFWEQIPELVIRKGCTKESSILIVAQELAHRGLVEFNESGMGFMLTKLAFVKCESLSCLDKANAFFTKHQLFMAVLAVVGIVISLISII
jgi:hypothetical protein